MTNIENTTGNGHNGMDGAELKFWLRETRIDRILATGSKRRSNGSRRGFHVLAADGSIDKRATRERRLFGPNATPVVADTDAGVDSDWDGTYSLNADGSIDKRATRERRLFGEPEDLYGRSGVEFLGDDDGDQDNGDSFYVIGEDGRIDKEATRERRLFGSSRWN